MPKKAQESERKVNSRHANRACASSKSNSALSDSPGSEDDLAVSLESPSRPKPSAKRNASEANNDSGFGPQLDFSGEMSKILEGFGADINKTLLAKRRRLEQYTQESMRSTTKRVLDTTKTQTSERKKLVEEFRRQLSTFIQHGEMELEKTKDAEEKLQKLIIQQQKHQQQMRISQSQRLKALKLLGEQFFKGMEELENRHLEQYSSVHNDLRKEMSLLQKKILMDTQQQEMMNVRKSLQTMLL